MSFVSALLLLSSAAGSASPPTNALPDCRVGSYRLADGRAIDVAASDGDTLRWRLEDGTSGALARPTTSNSRVSTMGWTGRPDGVTVRFDCVSGGIDFAGITGKRIAFVIAETRFGVEGAELAGRLILPLGNARVPIVVLVHGSERASARDGYSLQRQFPAAGIGAFVYDKRGTGASSGHYTHDYLTLATDAIAAATEARRLAGRRAAAVGYQGSSQGGWVAPLAAALAPADFVVVSYGLAVSPIAAERESLLESAERILDPRAVTAAREIADAMEATVDSGFRNSATLMGPVRARYADAPWFEHLGGEFARFMLTAPLERLRDDGPGLVPGIAIHYDPMPVLRQLGVRQLWVLGGADRDAPSGGTAARLGLLADQGRPITTAIFTGAEHGMYEFVTNARGTRLSTRQPGGYFPLMRDFILHRNVAPLTQYGATPPPVGAKRRN